MLQLGNGGEFKRSKSWRKMFKQRDKGKDKTKEKEPVRKNSSGSESSLSQSSVTSSPKTSAKNTKHAAASNDSKASGKILFPVGRCTGILCPELSEEKFLASFCQCSWTSIKWPPLLVNGSWPLIRGLSEISTSHFIVLRELLHKNKNVSSKCCDKVLPTEHKQCH